eukprot:tig00000144_g9089.t1
MEGRATFSSPFSASARTSTSAPVAGPSGVSACSTGVVRARPLPLAASYAFVAEPRTPARRSVVWASAPSSRGMPPGAWRLCRRLSVRARRRAHAPSWSGAGGAAVCALDPSIVIRGAREEELEAVADLRARIFLTSPQELAAFPVLRGEMLVNLKKTFHRPDLLCVVAVERGSEALVASIDVAILPPRRGLFTAEWEGSVRAYISNLTVEAAFRRRGIARELVTIAERLASKVGARHAYLHVFEDNDTARVVYERMAYRPDKMDPPTVLLFNRKRRVRMVKPLPDPAQPEPQPEASAAPEPSAAPAAADPEAAAHSSAS